MPEPEKKTQFSSTEEQILNNPASLGLFLYALVPVLSCFNIYLAFFGKDFAIIILTILLSGFLIILLIKKSRLPEIQKIIIYRYLVRTLFMMFGVYLIYIIGVEHYLVASPWSFLFVFLIVLWMPDMAGGTVVFLFNLGLIVVIPITDMGVFMAHREYLIRFDSALILFSLLALSAAIFRRNYLNNLLQTRTELKVSEQRYKDQSLQLMEEIAHRDKIEKQLHHAIKMETVGRVAAGVAHDLNNILSGIVTYPDIILLDMEKEDPLRHSLEMIRGSGIKAAAIVDDLLTLSRRGVAVERPVDLRQIVEAYLHSPEYGQLIRVHKGVSIKTQYDKGVKAMIGSPIHLSKSLMNLVVNAAEAISGSGEIFIHVRAEILESPELIRNPVQGHPEIPTGAYVVFTVSDTGIGIRPQDLESIFEPFYTRKQMGRSGTGLGMAVVLETVNDHDGFIQIDSRLDKGTRVSLYFPATDFVPAKVPDQIEIGGLMGNNETLLVIDDEPNQREIAQQLLNRLGYQVHCCDSGEAGLEFLSHHMVDLVIIDIIMEPGMDGVQTCDTILRLSPRQKTLFVTGFSDARTLERARQFGNGPCLFKPYTLENMGMMVRERLKK